MRFLIDWLWESESLSQNPQQFFEDVQQYNKRPPQSSIALTAAPDQPDSQPDDKVAEKPLADADVPARRSRPGCARMFFVFVLFLALAAGSIWYAIQEAQKLPDFYAQVLQSDEQMARAKGKEFERNLIQLRNSARRQTPWKIEFSQDQINGWLTSDLPEKFPESIPNQIKDPRAIIGENELKLAFKYEGTGLSGIIVVRAEVFCTEHPNEIAVRVIDVRSGFLPLPINPWIERVADSIRKAGIPMYWSNAGDSQVAVFTIPEHLSLRGDSQQVVVEAIELLPGKLIVAGRAEDSEPEKTDTEADPKPRQETEPEQDSEKNPSRHSRAGGKPAAADDPDTALDSRLRGNDAGIGKVLNRQFSASGTSASVDMKQTGISFSMFNQNLPFNLPDVIPE